MLAALPEADVRRLDVFIGVRSARLRRIWRIVAEGPVDLYLHAPDELPTIPGSLERAPRLVRVIDAAPDAADPMAVLRRPLQYDAFVDLLVAVEQQLDPASPPPAVTERPAGSAAAPGASLEQSRFRLKRWPGAGVLQSVRHGMRMASFISARYLSVDELARLSGVDRKDCSSFLSTLMEAELLRSEPLSDAPSAAAARRTDGVAASAPRPDRGLLSSLRQKLGIRPAGR